MVGLSEMLESAKGRIKDYYSSLTEWVESAEVRIVDYYDARSTPKIYVGQILRAFIALPPALVVATAFSLLLSTVGAIFSNVPLGIIGFTTDLGTPGFLVSFWFMYRRTWNEYSPEEIKARWSIGDLE